MKYPNKYIKKNYKTKLKLQEFSFFHFMITVIKFICKVHPGRKLEKL